MLAHGCSLTARAGMSSASAATTALCSSGELLKILPIQTHFNNEILAYGRVSGFSSCPDAKILLPHIIVLIIPDEPIFHRIIVLFVKRHKR